jgi:uncharacterized membrane protein
MSVRRHGRFFVALAAGVLAFLLAGGAPRWEVRLLVAGNVFFLAYVALTLSFVIRASAEHLQRAAAAADEGIGVILVVAGAAVVASLGAVGILLTASNATALATGLAVAAIPLGWLTTHTIAAFHYANLYYAPRGDGFARGLDFPGEDGDPGPWDFLYFAFVLGMTAQVSDVSVSSQALRRWVLVHGILSFFYYTGIVALAVNALGGR